MKYLWTTIHVSDLARSLGFYEKILGLPVRNRLAHDAVEIVFLGEGETLVELFSELNSDKAEMGTGVSLGFKVPDLDASMIHMKAHGIEIVRGPIQAGPRTRFFFVKDPDGVSIQFVEES